MSNKLKGLLGGLVAAILGILGYQKVTEPPKPAPRTVVEQSPCSDTTDSLVLMEATDVPKAFWRNDTLNIIPHRGSDARLAMDSIGGVFNVGDSMPMAAVCLAKNAKIHYFLAK